MMALAFRSRRMSHATSIAPLIAVERKMARLLSTSIPVGSLMRQLGNRRHSLGGLSSLLHILEDAVERQHGERCKADQNVRAPAVHRHRFSPLTAPKVKETFDS